MKLEFLNDDALINAIVTGGFKREQALKSIYLDKSTRQQVIRYIKSNSGNQQDGEDMYQEGLVVLDRNIRNQKFKKQSSIKVYLISICKFLWMNQIRKHKRVSLSDDHNAMDGVEKKDPEFLIVTDERSALLDKLLDRLGEKCKRILTLWKLSYSMPEIAEVMSLSSEAMARKNKYNCLKKLKEIIHNQPEIQKQLKV